MAGSKHRLLPLVLFSLLSSCSRKAEIANEPDGGSAPPTAPRDLSPLHSLDAGFDGGTFTACADRPSGDACRGANDFPCNFQPWAVEVVTGCQTHSGCLANGRVVIEMGDDGCVADLLMSEPNDGFAACAIERLGAYRCECHRQTVEVTLGYGNEGCDDAIPCQSHEFPCPTNMTCGMDGFCHRE